VVGAIVFSTPRARSGVLIARTLQPPHPRLILHHPPPSLQRLIHLLWPDSNAQFRFSPDNGSEAELADRTPMTKGS
jgi:hypothetical protein